MKRVDESKHERAELVKQTVKAKEADELAVSLQDKWTSALTKIKSNPLPDSSDNNNHQANSDSEGEFGSPMSDIPSANFRVLTLGAPGSSTARAHSPTRDNEVERGFLNIHQDIFASEDCNEDEEAV